VHSWKTRLEGAWLLKSPLIIAIWTEGRLDVPVSCNNEVCELLEVHTQLIIITCAAVLSIVPLIVDCGHHRSVLVGLTVHTPIGVESVMQSNHGDMMENVLDDFHWLVFVACFEDHIADAELGLEGFKLLHVAVVEVDVVVTLEERNCSLALIHGGYHTLLSCCIDTTGV